MPYRLATVLVSGDAVDGDPGDVQSDDFGSHCLSPVDHGQVAVRRAEDVGLPYLAGLGADAPITRTPRKSKDDPLTSGRPEL